MAAQGNSERGDERAASAVAKAGAGSRPALVVERLTHQDIPQI